MSRDHHRPLPKGEPFFDELEGGPDPARLQEAADQAATLLVRGARDSDDPDTAERLVHLAETEGMDLIADVWSGAPADSLAGALWRLYVLRDWVHADPVAASRQYDAGLVAAEVAGVVAGVADPPGPAQVREMIDRVLRGIAGSDFADVLFRASAFARVVAAGRAAGAGPDAERLAVTAEQLEHAARLELRHGLA